MEAELCGERLRRSTAVQFCMTCLDTDSNMYSISEYKLEQVYEDLTGYPLFDMGHIKHTLCEQCAQSLTNFNKFRDKSLRARAMMMDFVKQHKVVSAAALRPLQAALVPRAVEGEPAVKVEGEGEPAVKVEVELGADSILRDAKLLDVTQCRVLLTRSRAKERALANQIAPLPARLATNDGNNIHPDETEQVETIVKYEQVFDIDNVEADDIDKRDELRVNTLNVCFETTCDAVRKFEDSEQDESLSTTRELMSFSDSRTQNNDTDSEDFDTQTTGQGEFPLSEAVEPVATNLLVKHIRSHTEENSLTCNLCHYKFRHKRALVRHMRNHTDEKSFVCKLCPYKSIRKSDLVSHMRTHTGEKPFACELCESKFSKKMNLVSHMRTHTGEKPFACELCEYKFAQKSHLVSHMRTHTREKPFACELCQYQCSKKGSLVNHMRIHTGEKPFACKLCEYKCSQKSSLVRHMRTHTGEKPVACELCEYKCSQKSHLVSHVRTHTGEKPFACKLCHYKFSQKKSIVKHMRTHIGENPFAL